MTIDLNIGNPFSEAVYENSLWQTTVYPRAGMVRLCLHECILEKNSKEQSSSYCFEQKHSIGAVAVGGISQVQSGIHQQGAGIALAGLLVLVDALGI